MEKVKVKIPDFVIDPHLKCFTTEYGFEFNGFYKETVVRNDGFWAVVLDTKSKKYVGVPLFCLTWENWVN